MPNHTQSLDDVHDEAKDKEDEDIAVKSQFTETPFDSLTCSVPTLPLSSPFG